MRENGEVIQAIGRGITIKIEIGSGIDTEIETQIAKGLEIETGEEGSILG